MEERKTFEASGLPGKVKIMESDWLRDLSRKGGLLPQHWK